MADQNINVRIKHKYDTEANWSSKNPVLLQGEIGFINDGRYKVGNGTSKWNDLQYATADSLVRHVPGEGFEYGYAYSKTITIPKTTAATTYYVQIAKDASFRFKNYYIKTNGNNTQYSFRAEISANAYMSPHVTLNSQLYNAPEIKSILICKGNNYTHNIFLVIDSSTSVAKTIYIQSDNTILDTVSTTAPTTTTELTVNLITDSYIYTSKKIVANITGSAGSVSWNGITGKPSTFTPSPHIHDDRYYTETEINNKLANYLPAAGGTLTGALTAPSITASNYCMTPVMLGDDNLSTYYHRIDLGHTNVNYFDFYEYGGIYNFYQNQSTGKDKAVLLGKITSNGWEGNVIGNLSGNAATATNASKVNNHTVNSDVPSGAKFTDTIYTHPSYTAKSSGLYKVTVDDKGHVSATAAVTKSDITGLGIPGSDTNTWRPLGTTADTACAGNDSRLSNARPASDVPAWAKASSKPSYSWGEITGKPGTFNPSGHSHKDLDTIGTVGYYGSDVANSNGWYKVYSTTLTNYNDHVARLSIVSGYYPYASGLLILHLRCNNTTSLAVQQLIWETRQGFNADDVIINTNGNTWTLYLKITNSQYGRVKIRVLESMSTTSNWSMSLSNNSTKESTNPKATATAKDGATVNYANSAGSVAWGNVSGRPSSLPASDVYSWAKASSKPSYSKSEVGLGNVDNTADSQKSVKYATSAGSASTVNGHTVNADVPAGAKFTDTDTWRGIQDNLTSTSTSDSLSANQGKVLKGLIDGKSNSGHTHSTATTNASGFMSSTDKIKLDTLASGMDAYFTQDEINTIFT